VGWLGVEVRQTHTALPGGRQQLLLLQEHVRLYAGLPEDGDASGTLIDYTYDLENRLVQVEGPTEAALEYDPLGRLSRLAISGNVTQFLYDGGLVRMSALTAAGSLGTSLALGGATMTSYAAAGGSQGIAETLVCRK
jgi:hypothetical protein